MREVASASDERERRGSERGVGTQHTPHTLGVSLDIYFKIVMRAAWVQSM